MPSLFIITGSNGAGKSTFGHTYLPPRISQNYVPFDGDKLALKKRLELSAQIKSHKEARNAANEWVNQQFIENVKKAIRENDHFVYEGHFRNDDSWKIPKLFKRKGYTLSLIFMGLDNPDQSELRVLERAKNGGHNVPEYEIIANFYGNLEKVNRKYKIFDEALFVDTSESAPKVLLHLRQLQIISYTRIQEIPHWFSQYLPGVFKIIKAEEKK
jgi:predicted ABC-type ATPase